MEDYDYRDKFRELERDYLKLKRKIANLEEELVCNACGSRLRRTTYQYYCTQEFGPCGELLMTDEKGRGKPHAFFSRTSYEKDGLEPRTFRGTTWTPYLHLYFVAGEQVSAEDYYYLIETERET
jgi:hypothetical protein